MPMNPEILDVAVIPFVALTILHATVHAAREVRRGMEWARRVCRNEKRRWKRAVVGTIVAAAALAALGPPGFYFLEGCMRIAVGVHA
jgi:hypothetical protein